MNQDIYHTAAEQLRDVNPSLKDPIQYRKSGLSLNHIVGCPLDCSYCVCHLFGNFDQRQMHALMSEEQALQQLSEHRYFLGSHHTDPSVQSC